MTTPGSTYRFGIGLSLLATLMLVWLAMGVGILGADGDRANMMYVAVVAVGIIGAIAARLQPIGMSRTLVAMAIAQTVVTVIALLAGVQNSGVSPVAEIVGLNAFFIGMFLVAARLFASAGPTQGTPDPLLED